jgi:hypothetical protein
MALPQMTDREDGREARMEFRCKAEDKDRWREAAREVGRSLSDWANLALNQGADEVIESIGREQPGAGRRRRALKRIPGSVPQRPRPPKKRGGK